MGNFEYIFKDKSFIKISFLIRFETTRQTLCHEGDSMLAAMFNVDSNFSKPGIQENGAYFLDRDPKVFEVLYLIS